MKVFNCEIFTPAFEYVGSGQTNDIKYAFDYTDVEKNSVELKCKASIGDYIVIYNDEITINGIICDISATESGYNYKYKSFNKIFDVNILARFRSSESVEQTLARLITETYIENDDELQNIDGLFVEPLSNTVAEYGFSYEDGTVNLFSLILEAFTTYNVVCDFIVDRGEKTILVAIKKVVGGEFNIESRLANILEKNIVIKHAKDTTNKILIYNQENLDESTIYYIDEDDVISQNPEKRKTPVIFTTKGVKVSNNQTFAEKALKEAGSALKKAKYENLMEFSTESHDLLLRPLYRSIGQVANIYHDGMVYVTIMSGYKYNKGIMTLIFGTVRLELTKQIKKNWRMEK